MPIVISRSGAVIPAEPVLTQEQKDKLWESIIKNWAQRHPDALKNLQEVKYGSSN